MKQKRNYMQLKSTMKDHATKDKFNKMSINYQLKAEILTSNDIYVVTSRNGKTIKTCRLEIIIRKKVNNSSSNCKTSR